MQNVIGIDASGLFAFFQMQKPGLKISDLNISSKLKKVYYEFLLKNITLIIPVPALSELMYKAFSKGKIIEFNNILAVYNALDNVHLIEWDVEMLEEMGDYLAKNQKIINDYFFSIKRKPEIFDLAIYHCCLNKNVNTIVSKDEIFDKLFKLERVW